MVEKNEECKNVTANFQKTQVIKNYTVDRYKIHNIISVE